MRTAEFESKNIYYPDSVAFCFNPNLLKVETSNEVTVTISAAGSGMGGTFDSTFDRTFHIVKKPWYTDQREYEEGLVELDLSPYMRALFEISRPGMVGSQVITVNVKTSADEFEFTMTAIWGATVFDGSIKHLDVSEVPDTITVIENDCENGIYLRWIDRHGFYQYWLFQQGTVDNKSDEYGEKLYGNFSDGDYSYYGVGWNQGKTMEKSFKACAPLVDNDTFNMLLTVHSSPLVDMYVNSTWVPVNIASVTASDNGENLKDFEITVTMPDVISQVL